MPQHHIFRLFSPQQTALYLEEMWQFKDYITTPFTSAILIHALDGEEVLALSKSQLCELGVSEDKVVPLHALFSTLRDSAGMFLLLHTTAFVNQSELLRFFVRVRT